MINVLCTALGKHGRDDSDTVSEASKCQLHQGGTYKLFDAAIVEITSGIQNGMHGGFWHAQFILKGKRQFVTCVF